MAIMDFKVPTSTQQPNRPGFGGNAQNDRPQAKLWLNVGYEINGKFVNLPLGMPIDTMEPVKERGSNEDWLKLTKARNELLEALKKHGFSLEPGQECALPALTIQLRRIDEKVEIAAADNEYVVDIASMLAGAGSATHPQIGSQVNGSAKGGAQKQAAE